MNFEILQMLIQSACSDGIIGTEEKQHILEKAKELDLSEAEIDFLIQKELEKKNNPSDLPSGFVSDKKTNTNTCLFTEVSEFEEQGGMSMIQKAKYLGKWVIVKRLKAEHRLDETFQSLFFKEFEISYHLDHPNIIRFYDKGQDDEGPYFVMEYIDGIPLTERIKEKGQIDPRMIKRILLQILDALAYVHKKQVFHRDLKPDNILLSYKGDNVKIIDFGLALNQQFTDGMLKVGSDRYSSPEQKTDAEAVDQKSDIYSFGIVFYEMLMGFGANIDLQQIENTQFKYIIEKCIQQNPSDRFDSCEEIIEALNEPEQVQNIVLQPEKTENNIRKNLFTRYPKKIYFMTGIGIAILGIILFVLVPKIIFNFKFANSTEKAKYFKFTDQGKRYFNTKEYDIAKLYFDSAAKINPYNTALIDKIEDCKSLMPLKTKADELFARKNIARAQQYYKLHLKKNPGSISAIEKIEECEKIIESSKNLVTINDLTGKFGFKDENEFIIIDFQFEDAISFTDDLGAVRKNRKWGFVNKKGIFVIRNQYDSIIQSFHNQKARIKVEGAEYFINKRGKPVDSI